MNQTALNTSTLDNQESDNMITDDSDFVLNRAIKQAKAEAVEEQMDKVTLRVCVYKVQSNETFICLECHNHSQRDQPTRQAIQDACERQQVQIEKEGLQAKHYIGDI